MKRIQLKSMQRNNKLYLCLILVLSIFVQIQPAIAGTNVPDYKALVTASSGLNVRSGPGVDYPKISQLRYGSTVTVTHEYGSWSKIELGPTKSAYVSSRYLKRKPSATAGSAAVTASLSGSGQNYSRDLNVNDYRAIVTASALNVRSGPGTNYRIIGKRYRGSSVMVTHQNGIWLKLVWRNGSSAYVHGNYLRRTGSASEAPGFEGITDPEGLLGHSSAPPASDCQVEPIYDDEKIYRGVVTASTSRPKWNSAPLFNAPCSTTSTHCNCDDGSIRNGTEVKIKRAANSYYELSDGRWIKAENVNVIDFECGVGGGHFDIVKYRGVYPIWVVNSNYAVLQKDPGCPDEILLELEKGTPLLLEYEWGDFFHTEVNGISGWVYSGDLARPVAPDFIQRSIGVCFNSSIAYVGGVTGDICLWGNREGQTAVIGSAGVILNSYGGGGAALNGYADTDDLSKIGGLTACGTASAAVEGAYCLGLPNGSPQMTFGGISTPSEFTWGGTLTFGRARYLEGDEAQQAQSIICEGHVAAAVQSWCRD